MNKVFKSLRQLDLVWKLDYNNFSITQTSVCDVFQKGDQIFVSTADGELYQSDPDFELGNKYDNNDFALSTSKETADATMDAYCRFKTQLIQEKLKRDAAQHIN